jgi:excinuclease UvrABC nuclease subunit
MQELDCAAAFDLERADEFFAALPARPGVLLIEPRASLAGARPLLLRTADLRRRLRLLLNLPDPASKRVNLREYAAGVRFRVTGSPFEQALVHWQHARALWPRGYRERLRLRPPALVKLNLTNAYPRAYVTRRAGASGLYVGPFATRRAAETFLEPLLDLFRMRRCQIKIRRDPAFPGCIYSEMKMCLAPCFAGCTPDEYAAEVDRVAAFLGSGGASLAQELEREREAASSALDFERAAALHKRVEKTEAVRRGIPELVRRLDTLDAVVLQRGVEENAVAVFAVRGGRIADPFLLRFAELASQPRSVEEILRGVLESASSAAENAPAGGAAAIAELEDHLALLARWFYARPRQGEILFAEPKAAGWPYRRILRACSRLLGPPAPEPAAGGGAPATV